MQGRSWMAALTVAVGTALPLAPAALAGDGQAQAFHTVKMNLRIAGLGPSGCDVVVKPAHGGCRFRPATTHVNHQGLGQLVLSDVQTSSADRACAFSITIREAGRAERTVSRGLVLASPRSAAVSTLDCYLNSPSKIAQAEEMRKRR